jgi:hypothetical protein
MMTLGSIDKDVFAPLLRRGFGQNDGQKKMRQKANAPSRLYLRTTQQQSSIISATCPTAEKPTQTLQHEKISQPSRVS